jgi:murein DD-endopeptidase MepM/ murein hydrolase activator NlpD
LISNKKRYYFDEDTLEYRNKDVKIFAVLKQFFRFFSIASLFSFVLIGLSFITIGSPAELFFRKKIEAKKADFITLNAKIDSLQNKLHSKHFTDDQLFRELLDLDSLPSPMREAGIGGSAPHEETSNYPYNKLIATTARKLTALKKQISFQNNSYQKIYKQALIHCKELEEIPAIQPVKPTKDLWISSYYGSRKDPFTLIRRSHTGIDFVGERNTKIYATAKGTIKYTKNSHKGYGKEVVISHLNGFSTRYAHLNKILIKEGQKVERGQLVGLMGSTGRSTGRHLHYEVRINNRHVNPIYYYSDDVTIDEYELITNRLVLGGN